MSVNRWMDKIIVVYPYNGMLVSHRNEWTINTTWLNLKIMLGEKVMIPLPENLKNTMSTLLS